MARPKKPEHERKSSSTFVRMTDMERAQVEQYAAAHGLTLAEFFRRRALGYRLPSTNINRQQLAEATTALLRIGVNLNQLAKHVNAGRDTPVFELSDLIARINSTMDALDESGGIGPGQEL